MRTFFCRSPSPTHQFLVFHYPIYMNCIFSVHPPFRYALSSISPSSFELTRRTLDRPTGLTSQPQVQLDGSTRQLDELLSSLLLNISSQTEDTRRSRTKREMVIFREGNFSTISHPPRLGVSYRDVVATRGQCLGPTTVD